MKKCKGDDVFHLIPEEDNRHLLRRSQLFWLFLIFAVTSAFVVFGGWYLNRHILVVRIVSDWNDRSPVCSEIPNLNKFDCHPENGLTEDRCLQRGCCYKPIEKTFPPLNVPFCYYPSDYNGYIVDNITQDGKQIIADLKRKTPSGFPSDIQNLHLAITFINDCTLRVKITDVNAARFEVPIPINAEPRPLNNPCYTVNLNSKTGQLLISRKSNGAAIFKTNLNQMVYSDQFLQLSSDLPSSYIYGIGEHYGSLLKSVNWTRLTLLNSDQAPIPNYPLYGSQPFYLSLEKGGLANGVFLLNSNPMDVILQPTPAITFRPIGGILDFFIMLGPSPMEVSQQYTSIVGRSLMPPYWSLGFHLCRYGYNSLNKTKETMERNIDANIPLDVQWNDIDYMDRYKDFTYDETNFAGLPDFVEFLHNRGMHYVVMTDPGISNAEKAGTYPPYDDGLTSDVFIKNPNGSLFVGKVWTDNELVFPDFSHPNSTSYWTRQLANFHNIVQFDGVWIDMNEPSNFYDGEKDGCMTSPFEDPVYVPGGHSTLRHKTVCMTAKHYSTIHYNEHNLYGYREATATNEALRSIRQKRPFIISRATFAGQGTQSGHWSGDVYSTWEDMRSTIPSILNFNMFGIPMVGADICGFNHNTTVPLCARWQSLGAFYPFARNHNERSSIEQDPAALGPLVVAAAKTSLHLRYLLLPYLYTLFYMSSTLGDPVVRPIFFEHSQDENTYAIDEQFIWGSALMVIPVLYEGAENVTVYFPKGLWYTNEALVINSTGQKMTIPVPMTEIAIAIKAGFILPGQLPGANTALSRNNYFLLMATIDENKEAIGELFWDDGDSLDTIEKGLYTLIRMNIQNDTLTTEIVKDGYKSPMHLAGVQIAGVDKNPRDVHVNGIRCARQPKENEPQEMVLVGKSKILEYVQDLNTTDVVCVYVFLPPGGMSIGTSGVTLMSPLTVTWTY